ncbi:hypothetical protein ElyMa_004024600 [Elysia marginata]|uniref:Uncharacterized protein n=1 Tax=Elysia marginata TaxID=1093978 RepID=A0AAV4G4X1_9GAST|nr:hypothetical protein ElyMa_004024600 [Elysia marginata]
MWKHNDTAKWLLGKSKQERSKIMNSALKNRKELRQKHLEAVKRVNEEIKARLLENNNKMKEKELKEAGMKTNILDSIIADGGVCTTRDQLEELFQNKSTDALKNQIRYQKVFLNKKHLRLTGSKQALFSSLLAEMEVGSDSEPTSDLE